MRLDERRIGEIVSRYVSNGNVEGVVVVSPDGFPVYSTVNGEKGERAAAMAASFVSLAKRVATDLKEGELKKVVVETDRGRVVGVPLVKGLSLLVLVK